MALKHTQKNLKIPFLDEFKSFIRRGNVMDMAIGIIIGGAFGKIVDSLVSQVIMPPLGLLLGGVNFNHLKYVLKKGEEHASEIAIYYGSFLTTVLDFFIISFSIFFMIKLLNRFYHKNPVKVTKTCSECCMVIPVEAKKCGHCCSKQ